ncbi:hypothetical protein [Nocardia transvalensis]|uniref:hypothetical protein n=1 Tax=Nocardia transvalensis TaxID=37333 RepID=UPI0018934C78|nr:hypothetical protein [Nocardia transvalensis]MBF6330518.1 hypothetical protein [Nocardia transvalensis]
MKHIGGKLAAAGAVLASAFGGAACADADPDPSNTDMAKGIFTYTHHDDPQRLPDPRNNHCYRIEGRGLVENNTDRQALLFRGDDCDGKIERDMAPGGRESHVEFRSVIFIR